MQVENNTGMQHILESHPYIQEVLNLEKKYVDRSEFHRNAEHLLAKMGADDDFLKLVIKRNFEDKGFLDQKWSLYNIPFFYIYETADFYLKIHFFPGMKEFAPGSAAHCIHHHNNYILTTAAIFGSGYETLLFDKNVVINPNTLDAQLKITKHFTQQEFPVHCIDAWEPHLVFNPQKFSATLQLWTPDQKRVTDNLRVNPFLKAIKNPLRKLIYALGMEKNFGIASKHTYQWYPQGNHFKAIEENEYFEPTRNAVGPEVNKYSFQTIAYFIQQRNIIDVNFFESLINSSLTPDYYKPFLLDLINGKPIQETFCKESINIPQKTYRIEDVYSATGQSI
ncbi:MAG: hypothetical protein IT245_08415 [Bacteroidia bacterium]|nr:hypothetical protein [Bacteroidia bacterium]